MKQFLEDTVLTVSMFGPMVVGLVLMYMVFGFVAWELNPSLWTWEFRLVATIFGVCFGAALSIRVAMCRGDI
jgi:hypothetical protein